MAHLIGDLPEILQYNTRASVSFHGFVTTKWAEPRKHPTEDAWTIPKRDAVDVIENLEVVDELSSDWTPVVEL